MKFSKVLFIILCICVPLPTHTQELFAGPYRLVLHQIEQCDETGTRQIYVTSTRISKVSRTKYLYSTNLTTEVTLNDDVTAEVEVAKFGNGGWRPHYMEIDFPNGCTSLKQMAPDLYDAIIHLIHTECPIPPGVYEVSKLDIERIHVNQSLPEFPYGKFRTDLSMTINGTLVGCIRGYADVVPSQEAQKKNRKNKS
nr:uncharacterized protein LOC106687429 [Halyomorpha halys]